jgi:hypothetical protein
MRWVLYTHPISKAKRIEHLLNAFQTFICPIILTVDHNMKTASYKPQYFGDWLACIQHDVECAVRGYWQGYGLEE